jgi:HD-like signal output (HDOD) protein
MVAKITICIADPDDGVSAKLEEILVSKGIRVVKSVDQASVQKVLASGVDALIIDTTAEAMMSAELIPHLGAQKTPYLVIAAEATREDVIFAMRNGCLDWLPKPVEAEALLESLSRVENRTGKKLLSAIAADEPPPASRNLIRELARRIKDGNIDLPEVPQVLRELNVLLANLEVEADEVRNLIEKDPSLSARLVATANTAAYGGRNWEGRITDLKSTVTRLGNSAIRNLVQTEAIKEMFTFRSPAFKAVFDKMWRAQFMAACLAREIALALEMEDAEEVYLIGLMHNIGELFLLRVFGELFQKQNNQLLSMDEVLTMVREYHTVFGEALVRKWDLGESFAFTTRNHHDLDKYNEDDEENVQNRKLLYIVNLANQLAIYAGCSYHKQTMPGPSLPDSYAFLEMPPEARETLRDRANTLYQELIVEPG